jgi:glycosyltransferase involved in cell wall biosynthesis
MESPLRVLWVTTTAGRDGPGRVLSAVLRHWPRTDAVTVCTLRTITPESRADLPAHVPVEALDMRGAWDARAISRLRKLCRTWRPDIIHTQLSRADWIGRTVAASLGIPVVSTIHNLHHRAYASDVAWPAARLGLALDRLTRPLTDRFVSVSRAIGADLIARGLPADRVIVIPNGLDLDRRPADAARPSRQAIRREWGIGDDELVVGTVARLAPQKGIACLVAAAREVVARNPRVRFVQIGGGPLALEIRSQVESAGLAGRFRQIESVDEPMALLPGMDIFALPSLWEGLPVALLEAMASGLPSVVTRVAGNQEAVEDGRSGVLVPPQDPGAMANAILELASNPARRLALGAAAKTRVECVFDASVMATAYRRVYTDLLTARR